MRRYLLTLALLCAFTLGGLFSPLNDPLYDMRGDGVYGYADWVEGDSRPYGWVRADVVLGDPREAVVTAVHEQVHVEQIAAFGSRENLKKARQVFGKTLALQMESEAYCASARTAVASGLEETLEGAVRAYAKILAQPIYNFGITQDQAEVLIWSYCGE